MTAVIERSSISRHHLRRNRVKRGLIHLLRLAGVKLGTPGSREVAECLTWMVQQQAVILHRFPIDQNDGHTQEGLDPDSYWALKLQKFIHRADLLSFESPEGRQAVAELTATCLGLMASVWRLYGPPDSYWQPQADPRIVKIE